jgi:ketosteroid isomerase-like protein
MRANFVVAALLLVLLGCTPQQSDQLTLQQKDQIKSEVKEIRDSAFARFQRLDAEGAMQYYWDSSDFIALNPDGSRSDFQTMKKEHIDLFSSFVSLEIVFTREDFMVLSKDIAIAELALKAEVALKSGDKMVFDPDAVTLVFQKIAGQWKIIRSHESGTVVTQKAGKK